MACIRRMSSALHAGFYSFAARMRSLLSFLGTSGPLEQWRRRIDSFMVSVSSIGPQPRGDRVL